MWYHVPSMGSFLMLTSPSNVSIWRHYLARGENGHKSMWGQYRWSGISGIGELRYMYPPSPYPQRGIPSTKQESILFIKRLHVNLKEIVMNEYVLWKISLQSFTLSLTYMHIEYIRYIYLYNIGIFCKTSHVYANLVRIWVFSPTYWLSSHSSNNWNSHFHFPWFSSFAKAKVRVRAYYLASWLVLIRWYLL